MIFINVVGLKLEFVKLWKWYVFDLIKFEPKIVYTLYLHTKSVQKVSGFFFLIITKIKLHII